MFLYLFLRVCISLLMGKMQWNERLRIVFVSSVLKFNEKLFCIYAKQCIIYIYCSEAVLFWAGEKI